MRHQDNPFGTMHQVLLIISCVAIVFIVGSSCVEGSNIKIAQQEATTNNYRVSSTIAKDDTITQVMCGMVVGIAQQKLKFEKKSMTQTEQDLFKFCSFSSFSKNQTMMDLCNDMVIDFVPHVLSEILIANQEPLSICQRQKRGYDYVMTQSPKDDPNKTVTVCNICQLLVYEVELFIAQNESLSEMAYKLEQVCSTVPDTYQGLCIYTVEQYLPSFIKMVESELSPLSSCQMLGYCPTPPSPDMIAKQSIKSGNMRVGGIGKRRGERQPLDSSPQN